MVDDATKTKETFYLLYLTSLPRQLEPHLVATGNYGSAESCITSR